MKAGEDPPLLSDVLSDLKDRGLAHVVEEAAAKHHVSVYDVLGGGRRSTIVDARREVACRLYVEFRKSAPEVGVLLGGLDHTTVLNHLRKAGVDRRKQKRRVA